MRTLLRTNRTSHSEDRRMHAPRVHTTERRHRKDIHAIPNIVNAAMLTALRRAQSAATTHVRKLGPIARKATFDLEINFCSPRKRPHKPGGRLISLNRSAPNYSGDRAIFSQRTSAIRSYRAEPRIRTKRRKIARCQANARGLLIASFRV